MSLAIGLSEKIFWFYDQAVDLTSENKNETLLGAAKIKLHILAGLVASAVGVLFVFLIGFFETLVRACKLDGTEVVGNSFKATLWTTGSHVISIFASVVLLFTGMEDESEIGSSITSGVEVMKSHAHSIKVAK